MDVRAEDDVSPPRFPELSAQIPDQLESAEHTLHALTEALLERELPRFETGLRERQPEDREVVKYLVDLMNEFGLNPAANRGGWLQPVALEIVEPTGIEPRVILRPEEEPSTLIPPSLAAGEGAGPAPEGDEGGKDQQGGDQQGSDQQGSDQQGGDQQEGDQQGGEEQGSEQGEEVEPAEGAEPAEPRSLSLVSLGAFRQRSSAALHEGLPLAPLLELETPLPSKTIDAIVGRVALFRAPKDFELGDSEATARVDLLMAEVRDAGAIGCLLLTRAEEPELEQFRYSWRRQIRRAGASAGALLIEGLLGDAAREPLEAALASEDVWVLDLDLGTRDFAVESNNVIGRVIGRASPNEAVVLTCSWDTSPKADPVLATRRLITTLAAFQQLVEWSRRSTPPAYSLVLLLTVDGGLAAGHAVHAAWSSDYGAETKALVSLARPSDEPMPIIELSGRYDAELAAVVSGVVAGDGRDLIVLDQLTVPALAPYLRHKAPIVCVGAPDPAALEDRGRAEEDEPSEEDGEERGREDPHAALYADIRLLRNLVLTLANR